ncbi:trans-aconitate 2-methyltransferase [Luteitalea sp. TBR-22]|uniref:class I SAM-dependent methyltransferase n=1 Tax=Luteitalea sp. TBR-22 TaxID=2802971 RepID=UPI001AF7B7EB|nr:class I SAM-dependent methyltransferase [Luteitalea sp. TBR-22]
MAESPRVGDSSLTAHWDRIYSSKTADECSWHEPAPIRSLEAILEVAEWVDSPVVDVGGGESRLVDLLIERGYRNVTVVDISEQALQRARARLGEAEGLVDWVTADVGAPVTPGEALWPRAPFAVWHDRAVFHFLVEPERQAGYLSRLAASVAYGGHVVLATFDETGPQTCSGLPVLRRSLESLSHVLPEAFELRSAARFTHLTPWGTPQPFVRCTWQRVR